MNYVLAAKVNSEMQSRKRKNKLPHFLISRKIWKKETYKTIFVKIPMCFGTDVDVVF